MFLISLNSYSQVALRGDSLNIKNTTISSSYSNELWLDSNVYCFFKITLTQPFQTYNDSLLDNHTKFQNMMLWSKLDDFWVNINGCNVHPLKYIYMQDSSNLLMDGLFLIDDFEMKEMDSLDVTIRVCSGFENKSQVNFSKFYTKVSVIPKNKTRTDITANNLWYRQWIIESKSRWKGNRNMKKDWNWTEPCK
jgi:hypothetical protein